MYGGFGIREPMTFCIIIAMTFAADEMLGKLARWLRMLGIDVTWANRIEDNDLFRQSREEGRVILTRDTRLIRSLQPEEYLFIHDDYFEEQMREVFARFPEIQEERHPLSRCVECNVVLEGIPKAQVEGRVWPFVYQTQEHFTTCPRCRRVYWEATHVQKIRERIRRMMV
jgi:uncharacterized protein